MREWKSEFHQSTLEQGKECFEQGKVLEFTEKNGIYTAAITERQRYTVRIVAKGDDDSYKMSCKCPLAKGGGRCRHMAAVLYMMEEREELQRELEEEEPEEGQPEKENAIEQKTETVIQQSKSTEKGAGMAEGKITGETSEKKNGMNEEETEKENGMSEEQPKETQVPKTVRKRGRPRKEKTEENRKEQSSREEVLPEEAEGEFFILSEDGIRKRPPVEPEPQESAAFDENYTYFDCKKIRASCEFPKKVLKEAQYLEKSNSVRIKNMYTGYITGESSQVAEVEAVGTEGKISFPMRLIVSRTEVIRAECHCKECQRLRAVP